MVVVRRRVCAWKQQRRFDRCTVIEGFWMGAWHGDYGQYGVKVGKGIL